MKGRGFCLKCGKASAAAWSRCSGHPPPPLTPSPPDPPLPPPPVPPHPRWSVLSCMEALRHCDIETVGV